MKTYFQTETKISNPPTDGWYHTDKGYLYYFYEKDTWSCREDRVSDEYPDLWYQGIDPIKSQMIMKAGYRLQQHKVENLTEELDKAETGRMKFTFGYVDYLMQNWRLNPNSKINRWRTPEEMQEFGDKSPENQGILDADVYFRYLVHLAQLEEQSDVNK